LNHSPWVSKIFWNSTLQVIARKSATGEHTRSTSFELTSIGNVRRALVAPSVSVHLSQLLQLLVVPRSSGAVYSSRKLSVASQKLELLEEEWTNRGMEKLNHRLRDVLMPVAVGTATMGLGDVFASAGSAAVNHAGMHAAHNLASQSYHTLSSPPVTASFDSGIKDGIEQTFQVLASNGHHHFATNAATGFATPNSDAHSFGEMVGMHGTQKAVNVATGNLIGRGIGSSNSKKASLPCICFSRAY
jgi:hypothetical protein